MQFGNPWCLLLLILPACMLWSHYKPHKQTLVAVNFSSLDLIRWCNKARPSGEHHLPLTLFAAGLTLSIIAMARPQKVLSYQNITTKGIDIILCLDTSSSMQAGDLKPNRLEAAKQVSKRFVKERPNDRIGLVLYSAVSLTQCPVTSDHNALIKLLELIEPGIIRVDGTAIGNAIATCVNRLKQLKSPSKVVILLTDGRNNTGEIDPLTAADLASQFGIRIYTIGVGTRGRAPITVRDPFGLKHTITTRVDIDETTLRRIADLTGGQYFRATDNRSLEHIYEAIDKLEKTSKPKQIAARYKEYYPWFLTPAILFILISTILSRTIRMEVP